MKQLFYFLPEKSEPVVFTFYNSSMKELINSSSAQCLVKTDNPLYLGHTVGYLP